MPTARSQSPVAAAMRTATAPGDSTVRKAASTGRAATGASAGRSRGRRGEVDLRRRPGALLDLEVLPRLEREHARDDARRDGLPRGVVREHGVVVDLPRDGDLVLGLLELALELLEVLARAQLRVGLGDGEEPAEGGGEHVLRLRVLLDRRRLLRRGAG